MPFARIAIRPGVDTEKSLTLNRGGISRSQLIRFLQGLPQKMGGWQAIPNLPALLGTCRGLLGWASLAGLPLVAAGTEQRLGVVMTGSLYDITPVYATTNPAVAFTTTSGSRSVSITDAGNGAQITDWINLETPVSVGGIVLSGMLQVAAVPGGGVYTVTAAAPATSSVASGGAVPSFATTNDSATVTVTLANHGLVVGQLFTVNVSTSVGGLTISGPYAVQSVPTGSTFTITALASASSTAAVSENSGNARIAYLLHSGTATNVPQYGYGAGNYGAGGWGVANVGTSISTLRQWSLDHFGQDLIASYPGGAIYYWQPPTVAPAQVLSGTSPLYNSVVFVMAQAQIVIAAGAESGGTLIPTLVRWSDSGNFTDWTPTAINQAGSYQIPTGSRIVAGLSIGLGALIWTDIDLWSMTYSGLPYVFGFNRVGVAVEAISMRSPVVVSGELVVWPSLRGFYRYDGSSVTPLPCPVWDFLFDNLDYTQKEQMFGGSNSLFNEIWWFFPYVGAGMAYVKWNYADNLWDYGVLDRTAWIDNNPLGNPIGADSTGLLQQHEVGNDANGAPMAWSFQTGYSDLADGDQYSFADMVIPDFVGNYTAVSLTIYAQDNPNYAPRVYGPFTIAPTTPYVNVRVRGRQVSMELSGDDLGSFVRLGAFRVRTAPAGRR